MLYLWRLLSSLKQRVQQTILAAATVLASLPPDCHFTLLGEHTNSSASHPDAATQSLKKEIAALQRPLQVRGHIEIKLT